MTKLFSILIFFSIGYCQNLVPSDSVNIYKDSIVEDFSAIDKKGNAKSFVNDILSEESAIVLVFFRGFWWPHCRKQLVELSKLNLPRKVKIYAMSNENYSKSKSLQKQLYRKNSINFLEDNSGDVFDYFGIIDSRYSDSKREGIPYASTYVINKNRKVTYAYIALDYKERPSNKIIKNEIIRTLNE